MSQTEPTRWEQLAGALFDEMIVPLAKARREGHAQEYFARKGGAQTDTYFVAPSLRVMRPLDFEPHRGNAEGLVDAVTARWADQGETDLTELGPRMKEIAEILAMEPVQSDGSVDVLCYTLF